jgi:hypothetical protein
MRRRYPIAMVIIAVALGLAVGVLFWLDSAPPRTAVLWGVAVALGTLLFSRRREEPPDESYGPGPAGDTFGPVDGITSPG